MMEFLYFPEDKSLYIPAIISLIIFFAGALVAMYFFKKASKKEEEKWEKEFKNRNE
ncbi:hypothetical protein [Gracilibacillus kekensis]|uniref:Uncharacterized protein n=1 Tax=Gracilibacillus kekensis TaxID=1027249 RepID=A0A1M7MM93_9BACI|nr:hypothetical protein [Gracilibacillus kekensis]SHM92092.1 hypothetical protein SAMN05216179_1281 [Gracilibacillus kekensis]